MAYEQVLETLDQLQAMFCNTKQELKDIGLLREYSESEGTGGG